MPTSTLSKPFRRSSESVVFLHLAKASDWNQVGDLLDPSKYDLVVLCSEPLPAPILSKLEPFHHEVRLTDSRGRDVSAFLEMQKELREMGYQWVLKIHTFPAPFRNFCPWAPTLPDAIEWNRHLISELSKFAAQADSYFRQRPRLGWIAAAGHMVSYKQFTCGNYLKLEMLKEFYLGDFKPEDFLFTPGGMFWMRLSATTLWEKPGFDRTVFEPNEAVFEGSWAYVFHRAWPLLLRAGGYQLATTGTLQSPETSATSFQNQLSVVTRFHNTQYLDYLKDAGASLAAQNGNLPIEWIVVTKNFSDQDQAITSAKLQELQSENLKLNLVNDVCAPGEDGRSKLLNTGIGIAKGRYLCFLDYDDILLPDYTDWLTSILRSSPSAVAVGGCEQTLIHSETREKLKTIGRYCDGHRLSLFWMNYIPIHSFVVDRSKVPADLLVFDEKIDRCEDYDFLVRLTSQFPPDLSLHGYPLCVYRIRNDGSNTSMESRPVPQAEQIAWAHAVAVIHAKKDDIFVNVSAKEISNLIERIRNEKIQGLPDPTLKLAIKVMVRSALEKYPRTQSVVRRAYYALAMLRFQSRQARKWVIAKLQRPESSNLPLQEKGLL